jgi:hypothetical protein
MIAIAANHIRDVLGRLSRLLADHNLRNIPG